MTYRAIATWHIVGAHESFLLLLPLFMQLPRSWEATWEAVLLSDKVYVMGTHPGRLVEVVDLDLPRPRQLNMITQPKFIGYRQYLENAIGEIDLSKIK